MRLLMTKRVDKLDLVIAVRVRVDVQCATIYAAEQDKAPDLITLVCHEIESHLADQKYILDVRVVDL